MGSHFPLFVTNLEQEGPFLKVWGQTDKDRALLVEKTLGTQTPQLEQGVGVLPIEALHVGTLVCAKYNDNKYYRARIVNNFVSTGFIEVSFIDYGNRDVVPCVNIRSLQLFPSSFSSIPPLAAEFILAEAHAPGSGEWSDYIFQSICQELKYQEVTCTAVSQATKYYLIKLFINSADLGRIWIGRGLLQPVSLQAQQGVLLSMSLQKQQKLPLTTMSTPIIPPPNSEINTYKVITLEPGCQYQVYVSYVSDGPCHFSVQLKQSEEVLAQLMNDINEVVLKALDDPPIPGTPCLARCQEDQSICRAVVTSEVDNQFKVFYVDFGNHEVVPLDAIYQIPFKFVLPKVMAIRCSLHGVEKSTLTLEMQCAFKTFVDNRLLHMKVLPAPTRLALPKCELWDPQTGTSALEVVNSAAKNAYPEPVSLNRGFCQPVKVSFVHSCNRFYVQLVSKEQELAKLMDELQEICKTNEYMDPSSVKVGLPCSALYEVDNLWYRSEIVEILPHNRVKVRYIDYGNEEPVSIQLLRIIEGEQLTVLRPQAIECCLNGYQNMQEDLDRDNLLEELILENQFTMRVVEMVGKKALVELIDSANYNVASLLLDKIAASKSQISPMLVQAGNKIEHRKNSAHSHGGNEFNRNSPRRGEQGMRQWNDRQNENSNWRNDRKDSRKNERNSNDSNDTSWRQNNKGFNHNNDRKSHFNNRGDQNKNEGWTSPVSSKNDTSLDGNSDWNSKKDRPNFQRNNRDNGDRDRPKRDNYRKNDFKREGSEMSSSGSERSFQQRGPRTSSRNENKNYDKKYPPKKPFNNGNNRRNNSYSDASWNVSSVSTQIDAAPSDATYAVIDVANTESTVSICWFHNPSSFYVQLIDNKDEFKTMMNEIQSFYNNRPAESSVVGAPVIGFFPEDEVLYRAQVLDVTGNQYKVLYVDFGNISVIDKVWPIEKKFMTLPAQAVRCGLKDVAPPAENWPSPHNYSQYFDKDQFQCKFYEKVNDRFIIDLSYLNSDIRQQLIDNNLVVAPVIALDITFLFGQQFRAVLKSVNSLSDFLILLFESPLKCKMHNLDSATETYPDKLKEYLDKVVIVYVDNVVEDLLEVTLYDTEGQKLEIITPDEGAFDTVDALCPLLVTKSEFDGFVPFVKENSICLQPNECLDPLAELLEQLFEFYENATQEKVIVPEVECLYAVHSDDGNWYRARVLQLNNGNATVCYVDYGNTETVELIQIRELDPKFMELSMMCFQINNVTVSTSDLVDKDVTVKIYGGDNGWELSEIFVKPTTEASVEVSAATDSLLPIREHCSPTDVILEEPQQQKGAKVVISHIDSPSDFYLQLVEATNAIEALQRELQQNIEEMADLETPAVGVLCAAPYSVNQEWYRAQILDADSDITTVRFIDYGNTDVLVNKDTKIKTLPANLLALEVYATRSSLKIQPIEDEWSPQSTSKFETLVNCDNLTAEFIDQDEKTNYVELYANDVNVKDKLIEENLAKAADKPVDGRLTGFVSHLNSPSEFWIQLENCVDELEWIADQLSNADSFPELEDLTPGNLCAALYEDHMWYRARILSNTVAGIELIFIDYGNSCITSNLRQLPEDLVSTPALAQKCSLQKPAELAYWTPQAVNKFSEISADGQTIFTIKKLGTGESCFVELLLNDNVDVTTLLLPQTEDGFVVHFVNLDEFGIEMASGEQREGKYKLEPLPGFTWDEESTKKFNELYLKEKTLFQIEFLPEEIVRLYKDKSDIREKLGGLKNASPTSENKSEPSAPTEIISTEVKEEISTPDDTVIIPENEVTEKNDNPDSTNEVTNELVEERNEIEEKSETKDVSVEGNSSQTDVVCGLSDSGLDKTCENEEAQVKECLKKVAHDDKIVPGSISRPQSPISTTTSEDTNTEGMEKDEIISQIVNHIYSKFEDKVMAYDTTSYDTKLIEHENIAINDYAECIHEEITKKLVEEDNGTKEESDTKDDSSQDESTCELLDTVLQIVDQTSTNLILKSDKIKDEVVLDTTASETEIMAENAATVNIDNLEIVHEKMMKKLDDGDKEIEEKSKTKDESVEDNSSQVEAICGLYECALEKKYESEEMQTKQCLAKVSHDDKIVPGSISRPQSPFSTTTSEHSNTEVEEKDETVSQIVDSILTNSVPKNYDKIEDEKMDLVSELLEQAPVETIDEITYIPQIDLLEYVLNSADESVCNNFNDSLE